MSTRACATIRAKHALRRQYAPDGRSSDGQMMAHDYIWRRSDPDLDGVDLMKRRDLTVLSFSTCECRNPKPLTPKSVCPTRRKISNLYSDMMDASHRQSHHISQDDLLKGLTIHAIAITVWMIHWTSIKVMVQQHASADSTAWRSVSGYPASSLRNDLLSNHRQRRVELLKFPRLLPLWRDRMTWSPLGEVVERC